MKTRILLLALAMATLASCRKETDCRYFGGSCKMQCPGMSWNVPCPKNPCCIFDRYEVDYGDTVTYYPVAPYVLPNDTTWYCHCKE